MLMHACTRVNWLRAGAAVKACGRALEGESGSEVGGSADGIGNTACKWQSGLKASMLRFVAVLYGRMLVLWPCLSLASALCDTEGLLPQHGNLFVVPNGGGRKDSAQVVAAV